MDLWIPPGKRISERIRQEALAMIKILEAQHLCKTFNGKAVLNEISFQVKGGVWSERDSTIGWEIVS